MQSGKCKQGGNTVLFKRKNSDNWYFKFEISGQKLYRSTGTPDKELAQQIANQAYDSALKQIKLGSKPRRLWKEAVVRFINESQQKKSLKTEIDHFRWLSSHLDELYLDQINIDAIENLIESKLKETGTTRCNRMTGIVSAVLNKAAKQWGWTDCGVPYIRKFKESNQRLRWLTHEEADGLLAELKDHTKAMALFTLSTGLRHANVTGLEWSQIDMTRQIAWIHADQSKNNKPIRVPLNEDAMQVLREQRLLRNSFGILRHNRVFMYKGNPVDTASTRAWREALKRAGINDFCWHGLRHTWASWHVQAGTPLNVLQELGGWSSYEMVLRYSHLAPDHLADHAAKIERKVAKSLQSKLQLI